MSSPPAFPQEVTVFPERDFVVVDGWPGNTDVNVRVLRNGVVIGRASATTDGAGLAEINHPGGFCWTDVTPDILPGDIVEATRADDPTVGDATRTAGVAAQQATTNAAGQVVVHGTAVSATGGQIPVADLEQRIVQPDLLPFVGKRDIRAPGGGNGYTSTLTYDTPTGNAWTATFSGLSSAAADAAVAGQTRILSWMAANANGDRMGITIFEAGELGGPGFGGCPAGARNAVMAPGVVNAAAVAPGAPDVVFSGAAQPDATGVTLTVSDGTNTVTRTGTATGGAWSVAVPAADLAALADGTLTAGATYTTPGGTITGSNLSVSKDTVAPGAPGASPPPGTYAAAQSVTLTTNDAAAKIHYTNDGSAPTASSPVAPQQIAVTASQTLKAVAVDPAGNAGPASTFGYVISSATSTPAQPGGGSSTIVPGRADASRSPLALGRVTMRRSISRQILRKRGLQATLALPSGTEVLRVRLYRVSGRRRTLIATAFRFPAADGTYRLVLRSAAVRALRRGTYALELTPGRSRRDLVRSTTTRLTVS